MKVICRIWRLSETRVCIELLKTQLCHEDYALTLTLCLPAAAVDVLDNPSLLPAACSSNPSARPWKGWPRPCPLPLSHFVHFTFSHPSLTLIWKALVLTSSASDHNMSRIFWLPYIDVIHLSLSFVRLCSSVSASTVSNCLPVSVRCFSVWIHGLFLLWENLPYLTLQNTDATKHYQFTPRQSQWDFAFVAPPESSCILGRLRCSRLQ